MNSIFLRIGAILLHMLGNIVLVSYLTNFDLTGSWLTVIFFAVIVFVIIIAFIKHIVSFIHFIKSNP